MEDGFNGLIEARSFCYWEWRDQLIISLNASRRSVPFLITLKFRGILRFDSFLRNL